MDFAHTAGIPGLHLKVGLAMHASYDVKFVECGSPNGGMLPLQRGLMFEGNTVEHGH